MADADCRVRRLILRALGGIGVIWGDEGLWSRGIAVAEGPVDCGGREEILASVGGSSSESG